MWQTFHFFFLAREIKPVDEILSKTDAVLQGTGKVCRKHSVLLYYRLSLCLPFREMEELKEWVRTAEIKMKESEQEKISLMKEIEDMKKLSKR